MFKKIMLFVVCLMFVCTFLSITGCGDTKVINGIEYDTYGLINKSDKKNSDIQYELITGNIVLSIIFSESIVAPVYFLGFSIYEPVGLKGDSIIGQIK